MNNIFIKYQPLGIHQIYIKFFGGINNFFFFCSNIGCVYKLVTPCLSDCKLSGMTNIYTPLGIVRVSHEVIIVAGDGLGRPGG